MREGRPCLSVLAKTGISARRIPVFGVPQTRASKSDSAERTHGGQILQCPVSADLPQASAGAHFVTNPRFPRAYRYNALPSNRRCADKSTNRAPVARVIQRGV